MMGWIDGGSRVVGQTGGNSRLGVQEKAGISLYDEPTTRGNIYALRIPGRLNCACINTCE
jgi:hypothetical protein